MKNCTKKDLQSIMDVSLFLPTIMWKFSFYVQKFEQNVQILFAFYCFKFVK